MKSRICRSTTSYHTTHKLVKQSVAAWFYKIAIDNFLIDISFIQELWMHRHLRNWSHAMLASFCLYVSQKNTCWNPSINLNEKLIKCCSVHLNNLHLCTSSIIFFDSHTFSIILAGDFVNHDRLHIQSYSYNTFHYTDGWCRLSKIVLRCQQSRKMAIVCDMVKKISCLRKIDHSMQSICM